MTRRVVAVLVALVVLGAVVVAGANALVLARTGDAVTADPAALRPAEVVIVPGSFVHEDGTLGGVVGERVAAAVALHEAGVVDLVLLSGDHGTRAYDEPGAMRRAVLAAGVPAEDVLVDHAGFSTWHTMSRAHEVFGVGSAVVVTQDTYVARSVDLARAADIEAQGYVVGDAGRHLREALARVRGLAQATWRP